MLSQPQIEEIARLLQEAEDSRYQIDQVVNSHPDITLDEAYAVQLTLIRRRLSDGRTRVGMKVALTNPDVQHVFGVNEPLFGHLLDHMIVTESRPISCSELLQPKIEPEIAFVLKSDLAGPGVTSARVLAATAGVMPALEIPSARIRDWKFALADITADNAFGSRVVLGGKLTRVKDLDLRLIGVVLERNGSLVSTGAGASALGNPVDVVAWLANKMARYGLALKAGDVVLPGALVVAPDVHPGDYFRATFDRLGSVSAVFVE